MIDLLNLNSGTVSSVVAVSVGLNFVLSGISKGLEMIKDRTKTKFDNKAFSFLGHVTGVLQKVIDWTGGNRAH